MEEVVHLYNVTPRDDRTAETAPANALYRYDTRVRAVDDVVREEEGVSRYKCGDQVWVRPPNARCDQRSAKGTVTRIVSEQTVEVDGTPRHVKHLRRRDGEDEEEVRPDTDGDEWEETGEEAEGREERADDEGGEGGEEGASDTLRRSARQATRGPVHPRCTMSCCN